jgi:1-phosphofructokinase family hexose kinase
MLSAETEIVTVSLNPSMDRAIRIPGLRIGGHLKGEEIARVPAGKGVNVSRAMARMDTPSIATGFLSENLSDEFAGALKSEGIAPEFCRISGRTRENVTLVDPVNATETHIRANGPHISREELDRLRDKIRRLAGKEKLFIFAGSLPPGISTPDFTNLIRVCSDRGALVAVDTSGEALCEAVKEKLWLIKPNLEELKELRPEMASHPLEAANSLLDTVEWVLLSGGPEGAWLVGKQELLYGKAENVEQKAIRNTVGCGDCLLAGFVAGARGGNPKDAMSKGLAAATAAALTEQTANFDKAAFEKYFQRITISDLKSNSKVKEEK